MSDRPRVLGVVPVLGTAPTHVPALQVLDGRTSLARVVDTLRASAAPPTPEAVDGPHVVVTVHPDAEGDVRAVLGGRVSPDGAVLVVTTSDADLPESLRGALRACPGGPDDVVLVHEPIYPLCGTDVVDAVRAALAQDAGCAGAVPVTSVTDTLKRVDAAGTVEATVDREGYRVVLGPLAVRRSVLEALVGAAGTVAVVDGAGFADTVALAAAVRTAGGLTTVEVSPAVFRVERPDELALAAAIVQT